MCISFRFGAKKQIGKDKFNFLASILLKVNDFDFVFDHRWLPHVKLNQPICYKPTDIYLYMNYAHYYHYKTV
jgi:hypothetical protein